MRKKNYFTGSVTGTVSMQGRQFPIVDSLKKDNCLQAEIRDPMKISMVLLCIGV